MSEQWWNLMNQYIGRFCVSWQAYSKCWNRGSGENNVMKGGKKICLWQLTNTITVAFLRTKYKYGWLYEDVQIERSVCKESRL